MVICLEWGNDLFLHLMSSLAFLKLWFNFFLLFCCLTDVLEKRPLNLVRKSFFSALTITTTTLYAFNGLFFRTAWVSRYQKSTRNSAIAEGSRDALCQLKSCQLPRNSAVRQVLTKSKLWSWRVKVSRCVVNMCTQTWRVRVAFIVLQVSSTNWWRSSCVYHLYTDDMLWRNFLSSQCRNCSRDRDHAHLGNTHSSQH